MTPTPGLSRTDDTSREQFEAHIKTTAWYAVLSQAKDDDEDGASVYRMARMAAQEAWRASRAVVPTHTARQGLKWEFDAHAAGQAAYKAFRESIVEHLRPPPWDELTISQHLQWMAAAEAVALPEGIEASIQGAKE
jgi:hypothetical protein